MANPVLDEVTKQYSKIIPDTDIRIPKDGYLLYIDAREFELKLISKPTTSAQFIALSKSLKSQDDSSEDLEKSLDNIQATDSHSPFDFEIQYNSPKRFFCLTSNVSNLYFRYPCITLNSNNNLIQFRRDFKNFAVRKDRKLIAFDVIPHNQDSNVYSLDFDLITANLLEGTDPASLEDDAFVSMNPFSVKGGFWVNSVI